MAESLKQAPNPDDIYDALDMPQGEWVDPAELQAQAYTGNGEAVPNDTDQQDPAPGELTDEQEPQEAPAKPSPATIAPFVKPKRPRAEVKHEAPVDSAATEVDGHEADDAASNHAEYTYDERRTRQLAKLLDRALEQEVPTSQKNAQQAARSLKEVAQRISWHDGVATIRDPRGKGKNKSFVDTPINPDVAADLVDAAKAGTKQWGFDEETQQRDIADEPQVSAAEQTAAEAATDAHEPPVIPARKKHAGNGEIDPLTAPIEDVHKLLKEQEGGQADAPDEIKSRGRHAKSSEHAGKLEINEENVKALSGKDGVEAVNEMNKIVSKAKEEGRVLTKEEVAMLDLVVVAIGENKLADVTDDNGVRLAKGAVLQNLHDAHDIVEQKRNEQQERAKAAEQLAYAEEHLADLKGEDGVKAINYMNDLLRAGKVLSPAGREQLSRIREAMETFKLHDQLKLHVIENIRKHDDQYKQFHEALKAGDADHESKATDEPEGSDEPKFPGQELEHVPRTPQSRRERFSDKFKTLVAKFAAKGTNGIAILAESYQENQDRRDAYFNDEEMGKRRKIRAFAAVIGAGAVGAALGIANWKGHDTTGVTPNDYLGGGFTGGADGTETAGQSAADTTATAEIVDQPGEVFTVDAEKSPGFAYTFMDAAEKANLEITPKQSYEEVYEPLVAEGYISENSEHIKGIKVYQMENGDFGFASTGEVEYSHQMMQRMHELIEEAAERNK